MNPKRVSQIDEMIEEIRLSGRTNPDLKKILLLTTLQLSDESTKIVTTMIEILVKGKGFNWKACISCQKELLSLGWFYTDGHHYGLSEVGLNYAQELVMDRFLARSKIDERIKRGGQAPGKVQPGIADPHMNMIFLGHGRSNEYMKVALHITEEFEANTDRFERNKVIGGQVVSTLNNMMNNADFAVIVATAEDQALESVRTRQNVIHEIGLFQGKLGFDKVAVLYEEGVEMFSNNSGILFATFATGKIESTFGELDKTLRAAGFRHK